MEDMVLSFGLCSSGFRLAFHEKDESRTKRIECNYKANQSGERRSLSGSTSRRRNASSSGLDYELWGVGKFIMTPRHGSRKTEG
jgi:hypothetical protein